MARDYEVLGSNPATAKLYSAEPDNGGWHYCSRMLACCVFHYSTNFFVKQNSFFFIQDKYCHLTLGLHLIQSNLKLESKMAAVNVQIKHIRG